MNLDDEKKLMKEYVERWKRVGPILEEVRAEEIRHADTITCVAAMAGLVKHYFKHNSRRQSSGLIEQQQWFANFKC